MVVLLPNARVRVRSRAHPATRDAHGIPVLGATGPPRGPFPAGVEMGADVRAETGVDWSLTIDVAAWPIADGDTVEDADGSRVWTVHTAKLNTVPGFPDVDHVAVSATLEPPEVP